MDPFLAVSWEQTQERSRHALTKAERPCSPVTMATAHALWPSVRSRVGLMVLGGVRRASVDGQGRVSGRSGGASD